MTGKKEKENIQSAMKERIDYDELLNCTRCGFCLPSCPTYIETGKNEVHSPRGRIALMKGLVDGEIEPSEEVKQSINMCLGCRACEPVCPSGVRFGHLLEQARDALHQHEKKSVPKKTIRNLVFNQLFPHQNRMIRLTGLLGFYQRSGLRNTAKRLGIMKLLPDTLEMMEKVLPSVPTKREMQQRPRHLLPINRSTKKVAFFAGCLMDTVFRQTNEATTKLLQYAGCEIVIPETQGCCGALHGHSGEVNNAKEMAKRNIEAFEAADVDYIITNAGGCGAFLVDYGHLLRGEPEWQERAKAFSRKIKDVTSVLMDAGFDQLPLQVKERVVTYQDSCHLRNVQRIFMEPRKLLQSIEGVRYVEMKDAGRCCGSAGIYNITESEMSMQILDYKMKQTKQTRAKTVVTANPGCLLQMKLGIEREGLFDQVEAVHIADFLLEAYENGQKHAEDNERNSTEEFHVGKTGKITH
ncbi:glycolate oxidase iron-sulfur subunit [Alteribacillus persepolensis]|uniref:Glycolate oxidase iron-sulfur subunit n=1 Tax=Alteribacillus persepolensis TaxID=568899 RepID=A0A1G8HTL7_9BACI|nr:(Fe-S)-binding protein [Alteribacillus persepolensis]SDI09969.1 glycolate oxidase iron-sulfur subunit [Alteribacillus persepolensis]